MEDAGSGKEEEWTGWVFVARRYMSLLSPRYDHSFILVEETTDFSQIALSSQGVEARQLSWALFNVLVQSVEGKILGVMMNAERSNVDTYEPKIGGRWIDADGNHWSCRDKRRELLGEAGRVGSSSEKIRGPIR